MARTRWPPGREPWPLAQARQHRNGTAGGCQRNLGPADRSNRRTTSGVSRIAGQAGPRPPTLLPGQVRPWEAGRKHHPHPPCRIRALHPGHPDRPRPAHRRLRWRARDRRRRLERRHRPGQLLLVDPPLQPPPGSHPELTTPSSIGNCTATTGDDLGPRLRPCAKPWLFSRPVNARIPRPHAYFPASRVDFRNLAIR